MNGVDVFLIVAVAVMLSFLGGALVADCGDHGERQARGACEKAAMTWQCRSVSARGSDGELAAVESCACLDGGAP